MAGSHITQAAPDGHAAVLHQAKEAVARVAHSCCCCSNRHPGSASAQDGVTVGIVLGIDAGDTCLASPGAQSELLQSACAPCLRCGCAATAAAKVVVFEPPDRDNAAEAALSSWRTCSEDSDSATSTSHQDGPGSSRAPPGDVSAAGTPLCWMWGRLAQVAVSELSAQWFILLGDDTVVEPCGWPGMAVRACKEVFEAGLGCLVLCDACDPGYPSFPIIGAEHLRAFGGHLFPSLFLNQAADPWVAELYRRLGLLRYCHNITVKNTRGGLQLPDDQQYKEPLYHRAYPPHQLLLHELESWADRLQQHSGRQRVSTVDVLVPCGRADVDGLRKMIAACSTPVEGADVRFGVVVDMVPCTPAAAEALNALKQAMPDRLRLRFNRANLGASGTRNKLMEESLAELLVMLDDDVEPESGCVASYVAAYKQHPQAPGFAGSSVLVLPPAANGSATSQWSAMQRVVAVGVHMADVTFFWDAASTLNIPEVPWAVTANLALRNTHVRFDTRFPKTGGGEDVDLCLRAAGVVRHGVAAPTARGLVCMPEARVVHPWWAGGRQLLFRRFYMWAHGDGELVDLYPHLTHRRPPSGPELLWLQLCLLTGPVLLYVLCCSSASYILPCVPGRLVQLPVLPMRSVAAALLLPVVTFLTDALLDMAREIILPERRRLLMRTSLALFLPTTCYATTIRYASETGRLAGHLSRHGLMGAAMRLGLQFDWFGGLVPSVPAREAQWAWARFVCHILAGVTALSFIS